MKVAIVTLSGHYNYGNRLQNYALTSILEKLGCDVETLWSSQSVFLPRKEIYLSTGRAIKYLLNWRGFREKQINDANRCVAWKIREYRIKSFSDKNININYNFDKSNKKYDFYIVGSDQVWNPYWLPNEDFDYFLRFAEPEKRIAYAASLGIGSMPDKCVEMFRKGLNGIPNISVREQAGANIIDDLCNRKVPVLVDPTMLLSADEWRKLCIKPIWYKDEKYILTYFLGEIPLCVKNIADSLNIKIYNLMDVNCLDLYTSGVEEFLYLVDHAEFVCTDSFHACVFSILFHTPFFVVNRHEKNGLDMTSRLNTLTELFGLKDRFIDFDRLDLTTDFVYNIKFQNIENILDKERMRSIDFLKRAMRINI